MHGASNIKRQSVVDDEGTLKICTFIEDISTLGSSTLAPTCVIMENMNWNLMFSGTCKGAIATNIGCLLQHKNDCCNKWRNMKTKNPSSDCWHMKLSIQGEHKTCRPYNKQLKHTNGKKGLWK